MGIEDQSKKEERGEGGEGGKKKRRKGITVSTCRERERGVGWK